ncbi:MAG: cytidine/deoxycytidylate deaminase family protein [Candidatus Moranbacteria bacterium]|nr:cytidine/deoxycytidylate deaminase family protein [Candidatus Moranbacteria bacterium]
MEKEKEKNKRPTWDEYFLSLVELVGTRSTCDRGKSGCVIVRDKRILSTGYIGSPTGLPHCDDVDHEYHEVIHEDGHKTKHCIRTAHAEQNAIANAARFGVSLDKGTLYCHMTPCYVCAKMIINCGIKRVVCNLDYHAGQRSKEVFKEAGVKYELVNEKMETYKNM